MDAGSGKVVVLGASFSSRGAGDGGKRAGRDGEYGSRAASSGVGE